MIWIWLVLVILAVVAVVTRVYLNGPDLGKYDQPPGEQFGLGRPPSEAHAEVVASLGVGMGSVREAPRKDQLRLMRQYMDQISDGLDLSASFTPANAAGVAAEWVQAPGADSLRRLLYIHGGAFVMGSPRSHRNITSRFSEVSGCAVLAIDYRLMPEHSRRAGVEDCRTAYEWMLANGPEGPSTAHKAYLAGDSAGGNLALMMSAWSRDHGSRKADAVVALSPLTDATLGSPSMKGNIETDAMLGPMLRGLARFPRPLLLWVGLFQNRTTPAHPTISPVFRDLHDLPPTLVHVSEAEMLCDDGRRYVNRAVSQGSPARLQSWQHVVHVWHMFYPQLPEACEAWDEIGKFLDEEG
ncbi:alpha/beta hydrolase [Seongchinamella unica]|uniref:Alpha/beta hydrolase n=1 Tax=Seongchinamella unica TaxID=2547392 RepID=A0A4R5LWE5_9GAMM|nr:alpha/beta hydrolase [Seongchinamella unica]TDG15751.1 alpha/beta hydrolase [Seongchinamella unica]